MSRVLASAGERDAYVTIHAITQGTEDDSSFPTETPSELTKTWMQKIDVRGSERFAAGQLSSPFDTIWRLDYRTDMDPDVIDVPKTRRLVHKGRTYDIVRAGFAVPRMVIELETLAK